MKIMNFEYQLEKRMKFIEADYMFEDKCNCEFAFFENGCICYNSTNLISCFCALCLVRSLFIKDIYIKDDFCDFKDDYIKQLKYYDYRINEDFFNADNILKIDCLAYAYYICSAKIGINIPEIINNLDQVIIHASLYL